MNENEILNDIVYHYLTELGYRPTSMVPNVSVEKMPTANRVDLVVYDNDLPYLLVEVKSHTPKTDDPNELKFHPYVRELQAQAFALSAPYYLLTNGQLFLWFTTDSTGRPKLLATPVLPKDNTKQKPIYESKEAIIHNLRSLQDYFRDRISFQQINKVSALLVIAKLLNERGDNKLKNYLLSENKVSFELTNFSFLNLLDFPPVESTYLEKAFEILDRVNLTSIKSINLLRALDDIFFLNEKFHYHMPRTPRWLADFFVRLGQLPSKSKKIVMDIACGAGDILTAARLVTENADLWGISQNPESAFWTQLQLIALGEQKASILIEELPPYAVLESQNIPRPTHIITIPPLGRNLGHEKMHSELSKLGILQVEDAYLELGINLLENKGRIVALVPESMLFAQGTRAIRQFIKDSTRITAIISLDSGALFPYSNLKASILVLDKGTVSGDYDIFMAQIKGSIKENTFDSTEISRISETLDQFEQWTKKREIKTDDYKWIVSAKNLDIENFTVNRHFPLNSVKIPQIKVSDRILSIEQVATLLKYGNSIKLETAGSIRVIGPAAIKVMHIDPNSLNFITEQELPSKLLLTQLGDIVLSSVGASLGKAAVIGKDLANSPISRNIILIRPDRSLVIPAYLSAAINSDYVQLQFRQRATGSITPSLSINSLAEVTIPIPSLKTQQYIAQKLENAQEKVAQAQQNLEDAKNVLKKLIQDFYEEE